MIISKLDQRVELQQPTVTRDAMNGISESFATAATVWAQVEPLTGRELEAAQASYSEIDLKVIIRYYSGLSTHWRVKHGAKLYQIVAVLNLQSGKKDLKLLCKELPAVAV